MNVAESRNKSKYPGWLSEKEMSEFSGFSRSKLWSLRTKKGLLHSKIGGSVYYNLNDFMSFLEQNKINSKK